MTLFFLQAMKLVTSGDGAGIGLLEAGVEMGFDHSHISVERLPES